MHILLIVIVYAALLAYIASLPPDRIFTTAGGFGIGMGIVLAAGILLGKYPADAARIFYILLSVGVGIATGRFSYLWNKLPSAVIFLLLTLNTLACATGFLFLPTAMAALLTLSAAALLTGEIKQNRSLQKSPAKL